MQAHTLTGLNHTQAIIMFQLSGHRLFVKLEIRYTTKNTRGGGANRYVSIVAFCRPTPIHIEYSVYQGLCIPFTMYESNIAVCFTCTFICLTCTGSTRQLSVRVLSLSLSSHKAATRQRYYIPIDGGLFIDIRANPHAMVNSTLVTFHTRIRDCYFFYLTVKITFVFLCNTIKYIILCLITK